LPQGNRVEDNTEVISNLSDQLLGRR
jgi:hypothetical protein